MFYSEASKYLVEVMESVSSSDLEDVMEKVLDAVEKQPCMYMTNILLPAYLACLLINVCLSTRPDSVFPTVSSNMIELSVAESAVQDCSQSCDETMWVYSPNMFNYCLEYCQPPK